MLSNGRQDQNILARNVIWKFQVADQIRQLEVNNHGHWNMFAMLEILFILAYQARFSSVNSLKCYSLQIQ